jgi:DNA polymerase-3 subunit gamma/tau
MEQFIVSARKYRPQTFNDVVGQKAITNTLLNAIEAITLPLPYYLQGLEELEKQLALILARKINHQVMMIPEDCF